jgi:hypothetical protein
MTLNQQGHDGIYDIINATDKRQPEVADFGNAEGKILLLGRVKDNASVPTVVYVDPYNLYNDSTIPDGDHTGDLLYWDHASDPKAWKLLHPPSTPAVLAWDSINGLHWALISEKYMVVQRNASGEVVGDWTRAHD